VKIDQRNGRALRIGQTRESVRAIYFLPDGERTRVLSVVARKNEMRRRTLWAAEGGGAPRRSTLRPRVTKDAAIVRFPRVSDVLIRRHKAGIERLIRALSSEHLDDRKVRDLNDLIALEP
jgi:hypothetical protein